MKRKTGSIEIAAALVVAAGFLLFTPHFAAAHCDTLDGPVVATAKAALEKGDVTPVLKWVKKEHEAEIREQFEKALTVRKKGQDARDLADMYFFETLVRIHRAGEGAPYTGLKPAGTVEPAVAEADKALNSGSADHLVKMITDAAAAGIRERFTHVREAGRHADESVEAGREFVEAYVGFTHYVERLHQDAAGHAPLHGEQEGNVTKETHAH